MMFPRSSWELVKKWLIANHSNTQYSHLLLILTSQKLTFGRFDLNGEQYKRITGKELRSSSEKIQKVQRAIKSWNLKISKREYIHIPKEYLKIPLKNTFELKVMHYLYTVRSMGGKKHRFETFCKQYEVRPTRQNRYKFRKIVNKL